MKECKYIKLFNCELGLRKTEDNAIFAVRFFFQFSPLITNITKLIHK